MRSHCGALDFSHIPFGSELHLRYASKVRSPARVPGFGWSLFVVDPKQSSGLHVSLSPRLVV
jgi:hypothetical protein